MELSDLWIKMAKNENLTPQELDYLRIQGKNTQQNNAQTAGNTSADGKATFITPYIESPHWRNGLNSTSFDFSVSVATATETTLSIAQGALRSESSVYTIASVSTGIKISSMNNFVLSGNLAFDSNSTGYRRIFLLSKTADGTTRSLIDLIITPAVNGADTVLPISFLYDRVRIDVYNNFKLDYISIGAYQNSGSSLGLYGKIGIMEV